MRRAAAALLLASLALPHTAFGQARNVGPGVADRTASLTRGGSDEIIFGGEVQLSLEADNIGRRAGVGNYTNAYTESLLATYLLLPYGFSLNMVGRLEQTDFTHPGTSNLFTQQALWLDEAYVTWSAGIVDVFGGKIHPRFGTAWDQGPGLFGTDLGQQYELTQKIGAGLRLWLSDIVGVTRHIGTHLVQAEFFMADRTALSTSAFARQWSMTQTTVDPETGQVTERQRLVWRNRRATGTPDNTPFLGGTVVSAYGYGIPMPRGLAGYAIAWSSRKPGEDATASDRPGVENGYAVSAFWNIPLPWRLTFVPYAEWVRRDSEGGFRGVSGEYLTAGGSLRYTPFTLDYAFQQRIGTDRREGTHGTFVENALSLTWDLYFIAPTPILRPLSVTVGWRHLREGGVVSDDFGAQIGWVYKF